MVAGAAVSTARLGGTDVPAGVVHGFVLQTQYGAVFFDRGFHIRYAIGSGGAGQQVFAAIFDPFDRHAGFFSRQRNQGDVWVHPGFGAETAANIGGDDPAHFIFRNDAHCIFIGNSKSNQ